MEINQILAAAKVPEHSVHFMQAVSGGTYFVQNDYLCFTQKDDHGQAWLTIIGYPLQGTYSHEDFLKAKNEAVAQSKAMECFAIAPDLPTSLQPFIHSKDVFYTLSAKAQIPQNIRRAVRKGENGIRYEIGQEFTAKHQSLWTEFLGRSTLAKNVVTDGIKSASTMDLMVKKLFLATPQALKHQNNDLKLLNAYDRKGNLSASLLMDFAPKNFCSYLLGAHSKKYYVSHAVDALFAAMLELARKENKEFIHLGLGVNEGIRRFKIKWGAQPQLPYVLASWQEKDSTSLRQDVPQLIRQVFVPRVSTAKELSEHAELLEIMGKSKRQIMASLPEQRPYAMLWQVQKGDKISWIGGSAHFFCYSFEQSFRKLFAKVDTVLFEGPLDTASLQEVEAQGTILTAEQQPLLGYFSEEEIIKLERMVRGPEGFWAKLLNIQAKRLIDVRWYLGNARPWTALFTLWTGFLERNGWRQSVDLEAWNLAHDLSKKVVAMESLEEQLASLNSVPPERVVRYFQNCDRWPKMIGKNIKAYLRGDLLRLMGTSAEFPTRTHTIINVRDERFRTRMRPFLEQGRTAVFVGTAHMLNLRHMLQEDGFTLRQVTPTFSHKIRACLRKTP